VGQLVLNGPLRCHHTTTDRLMTIVARTFSQAIDAYLTATQQLPQHRAGGTVRRRRSRHSRSFLLGGHLQGSRFPGRHFAYHRLYKEHRGITQDQMILFKCMRARLSVSQCHAKARRLSLLIALHGVVQSTPSNKHICCEGAYTRRRPLLLGETRIQSLDLLSSISSFFPPFVFLLSHSCLFLLFHSGPCSSSHCSPSRLRGKAALVCVLASCSLWSVSLSLTSLLASRVRFRPCHIKAMDSPLRVRTTSVRPMKAQC
jgi:hypothetical protein